MMQSAGAVWEREMYNKIWLVIYGIFVAPERCDYTLREKAILGHSLVDQNTRVTSIPCMLNVSK